MCFGAVIQFRVLFYDSFTTFEGVLNVFFTAIALIKDSVYTVEYGGRKEFAEANIKSIRKALSDWEL